MRPESNGTRDAKTFLRDPRGGATVLGPQEGSPIARSPDRSPDRPREETLRTVEEDVTQRRGRAGSEEPRDEYVLSLGAVAMVLWRRLWVVLLTMLVLAAAAVGIGSLQTPSYEAEIRILVGQRPQGDGQSPNLAGDIEGLQQLTLTMTEAVDSRPVAEAVIREQNLRMDYEEFRSHLTVEQVPETQFVRVTYADPDPDEASRIANSIGDRFADQVSEVSPSANSITATVWERAVPPDEPASPDLVQYGLLAAVAGLMLGVVLAFLLEHLDDRWRSPEEAEMISGVPTFATIPAFSIPPKKKKGGA